MHAVMDKRAYWNIVAGRPAPGLCEAGERLHRLKRFHPGVTDPGYKVMRRVGIPLKIAPFGTGPKNWP